MATIISNNSIEKHDVNKYNFKVLPVGITPVGSSAETDITATEPDKLKQENSSGQEESKETRSEIDSSAMSQSSKDSLIESLMKKTDDMSSNFIKLQMKLEAQEEEHKEALVKAKEEGYAEGVEAGKQEAQKSTESSITNGLAQFASSVETLEGSAKEFESALEGIKNELITAALDIAKEVVAKELSSNSAEIAKVLSDELIKELQSASKVTLRVNPKDHGAISEHVGSLEHVQIISDKAVSQGGVVAISDAGNIDSQISKRFERVKRAALSE